jgi:hypothetical protein
LDKYSITSIFILVILCLWYAVIGTVVFAAKNYPTIDTDNHFVWLDRYVCFGFVALFIVLHGLMLTWLFTVPLAARRAMRRKDEEYEEQKKMNLANLRAKAIGRPNKTAMATNHLHMATLQ